MSDRWKEVSESKLKGLGGLVGEMGLIEKVDQKQ